MARGVKTPTTIKKLQGTYRNNESLDNEMQVPTTNSIQAPDILGDLAQKEWLKQTGILSGLGMLADADQASLIAYCAEVETYLECRALIKKEGLLIAGQMGGMVKHPLIQVANTARDAFIKIGTLFGFNPVARMKIEMPIQKPKDDFKDMLD